MNYTFAHHHGDGVPWDHDADVLCAGDSGSSAWNICDVDMEGIIQSFCQDVCACSHEGVVMAIEGCVMRVSRSPADTCAKKKC